MIDLILKELREFVVPLVAAQEPISRDDCSNSFSILSDAEMRYGELKRSLALRREKLPQWIFEETDSVIWFKAPNGEPMHYFRNIIDRLLEKVRKVFISLDLTERVVSKEEFDNLLDLLEMLESKYNEIKTVLIPMKEELPEWIFDERYYYEGIMTPQEEAAFDFYSDSNPRNQQYRSKDVHRCQRCNTTLKYDEERGICCPVCERNR